MVRLLIAEFRHGCEHDAVAAAAVDDVLERIVVELLDVERQPHPSRIHGLTVEGAPTTSAVFVPAFGDGQGSPRRSLPALEPRSGCQATECRASRRSLTDSRCRRKRMSFGRWPCVSGAKAASRAR